MGSAGNATSFAAAMIDLIEVSRNATAQFFKDDVRSEEPANASFFGGFLRQRLS
jgi:hypothetical protein